MLSLRLANVRAVAEFAAFIAEMADPFVPLGAGLFALAFVVLPACDFLAFLPARVVGSDPCWFRRVFVALPIIAALLLPLFAGRLAFPEPAVSAAGNRSPRTTTRRSSRPFPGHLRARMLL